VLEKEGVKVCTRTTIQEVSGESGTSVTLKGLTSEKSFEITGSHILCATGRLPNTDNIGLEEFGIQLTGKGFIETNESLETPSEGVFAVGDCAGSPHFTMSPSTISASAPTFSFTNLSHRTENHPAKSPSRSSPLRN
jgi:pyruvate/2-oxoglutarate dehydrogenase complex dihydrolipoamide dehydrogenase (E3) component